VVENVAEENEPVGLLFFVRFQHARAPVRRAMQVGRDHQFHMGFLLGSFSLFYRIRAKKRSAGFRFFVRLGNFFSSLLCRNSHLILFLLRRKISVYLKF